MTKDEARVLIEAAGGGSAFGRFLGIDNDKNFQQRVNNWKNRGIPPLIELEHYEKFQELKSRVAAARPAKKARSNTSRAAAA